MLKNLLNLIPAIIGTVQSVFPMVKELTVTVVRIIAVLPFLWNVDQPIIDKINLWYGKINDWIEKIKNLLLLVK